MAASVSDKFRLASGSTRPVVTSLALPKSAGATTAELTNSTGWNTTTGLDYVMYRRTLNATTGTYQEETGTRVEGRATLTGTTLSNMTFDAGTEPAAGYAADGNTVVLCAPTAQWGDDLVNGILSFANQDGSLKTAAVQTALSLGAGSLNGWNALGYTFNTVTANGNGSYDCVVNGVDLTGTVSPGMRLRTTNTVSGPTRCTSLNGTTQYYSKTSPAGMTFTDDFVAGAWVKLTAYGTAGVIKSRWDGTSGWIFNINAAGQVVMNGFNAGAANFSGLTSYQSIPLNKWVHVTAQLDMSTFTASTTTSYVMIDGIDVPISVSRGGTNPTALAQGTGALQVGAQNGALFFPGKIAQTFVSSAKITQANIRAIYSQGLTSSLISSNSIISAYSFDNSTSDLNTTNANNLTANGSAVATNADSFTGQQADGSISATLNYCIVQKSSFSTNTTLTVQVPEGCTIPTTGGVTSVVYSPAGKPYGFPVQVQKWTLQALCIASSTTASPVSGTWVEVPNLRLTIPLGEWIYSYQVNALSSRATNGNSGLAVTGAITSAAETDIELTGIFAVRGATDGVSLTGIGDVYKSKALTASTQTIYYINYKATQATMATSGIYNGDGGTSKAEAVNAYL